MHSKDKVTCLKCNGFNCNVVWGRLTWCILVSPRWSNKNVRRELSMAGLHSVNLFDRMQMSQDNTNLGKFIALFTRWLIDSFAESCVSFLCSISVLITFHRILFFIKIRSHDLFCRKISDVDHCYCSNVRKFSENVRRCPERFPFSNYIITNNN